MGDACSEGVVGGLNGVRLHPGTPPGTEYFLAMLALRLFTYASTEKMKQTLRTHFLKTIFHNPQAFKKDTRQPFR